MISSDLQKYVESARAKGLGDEAIKTQLVNAGWAEKDVTEVFAPPVAASSGLPAVPVPTVPHFGMWVAFEYILFFITLLTSAVALAGVFHSWVDRIAPQLDATGLAALYSLYNSALIRGYLATLIVAFPIFAVLFIVLRRQSHRRPDVKNLKTRKFLVYGALVWTFIALMTRVIRIVYGFLGGNTTLNALLHLLVTLIVSGCIFLYFIFDISGDRKAA